MRCERVAPGRSGISFAEALVRELDDSPVSVTALMPGPTETSFFHRAGMQDTLVAVSRSPYPSVAVSPDQTEPVSSAIRPLGRPCDHSVGLPTVG